MASMMVMEWTDITPEQYQRVFSALGLDAHPPAGLIFHVAGFSDGRMHAVDVWESAQAFEQFQRDRLLSAVQGAGISTLPRVRVMPAHNIYTPKSDGILRGGADVPLPA